MKTNTRPAYLPLNAPPVGKEEARAAYDAVMNGDLVGRGRIGLRLEERMAEDLGARDVQLTTSGTHALELATAVLGLKPGDEVILPSYTFSSVANAVLRQRATPVFADVLPDTLNLDPRDAARKITRRTRALVAVHYAGVASDMPALGRLCREAGIALIEDAAHAVGAYWRGRPLGTIGDCGAYSFHATKNVTCGEGGAFITSDAALARRGEMFREKGTNRSAFLRGEIKKYTWVSEGSSYVLSDVLAAIFEPQWRKRDAVAAARGRLYRLYLNGLRPLEKAGLIALPIIPKDCRSSYHLMHALLPSRRLRDDCIAALKERGVGATFHYQPLHMSPFGRRELGCKERLPISERAGDCLIRLPLHTAMTASDVGRVIDVLAAKLTR
jgi:dTDP-4-amino-4,6-dideoxygalactose transaminase